MGSTVPRSRPAALPPRAIKNPPLARISSQEREEYQCLALGNLDRSRLNFEFFAALNRLRQARNFEAFHFDVAH